ncbi:MAG: hypothetical protein JNM20_13835 [Rhizobiales bacterium]|nr:hypothetical protein [Hyphomicrobiales bacterium]
MRKWFYTDYGVYFVFLRDPVAAVLYGYCFIHGLFLKSRLSQTWIAFAAISCAVGFLPYLFGEVDLFGWLLGIRTYWLYMPLAFIVGATFRQNDVRNFLLLISLVAIPYAILIALQYNAGRDAWINAGVGGDDETVVSLTREIVRPFGLFTYTIPNVDFTAATLAIFLALYLSSARVWMRAYLLALAGLAISAMVVLTGSRMIYFLLASTLGLTLGGAVIARPDARTIARSLGVLVFVLLAAMMLLSVFPDMYSAMEYRFETAQASEGSIWDRVIRIFSFVDALFQAPPLGQGIGIGAAGVTNYLGLPAMLYGEYDLERNANELGILLGTSFIVLRFTTAAWLAVTAVRLARAGVLAALPLAGYAIVPIAVGQLTNSPLLSFMPFLAVGLVIALQRNHADPYARMRRARGGGA